MLFYKSMKNIILISSSIYLILFFWEDLKNLIFTSKISVYSSSPQEININKDNDFITINVPIHKEYKLIINSKLCKVNQYNFPISTECLKNKCKSTLRFYSNRDIPQYLNIGFKQNSDICEIKHIPIKSHLKIDKYFSIINLTKKLKNLLEIKNKKFKVKTHNNSVTQLILKHNNRTMLLVIKYLYEPTEDTLVIDNYEKASIKYINKDKWN